MTIKEKTVPLLALFVGVLLDIQYYSLFYLVYLRIDQKHLQHVSSCQDMKTLVLKLFLMIMANAEPMKACEVLNLPRSRVENYGLNSLLGGDACSAVVLILEILLRALAQQLMKS